MAFDLWLNNERESIEAFEEGLFDLIGNGEGFPVLDYIWNNFYASPTIEPEMSRKLIFELISILEIVNDNKEYAHIIKLVIRLLPFFSRAYKKGEVIQGAGD